MYTVSCETHFDSAHFLLGYKGGCKNIHGHRWVVSASVSSETLIEEGGNRGMLHRLLWLCLTFRKRRCRRLPRGYDRPGRAG